MDVDDWAQIIHLRVLLRIAAGEDFQNFDAWVRGFVPFVVKEALRSRVRGNRQEPVEGEDAEVSPEVADALQAIARSRAPSRRDLLLSILDECVEALRDDDRNMYMLRWGPGSAQLTSAVVADRLHLSAAVVDKRASRVRKRLEDCCHLRYSLRADVSENAPSIHKAS